MVLPPTIDEVPPPGMAIVEELDKKMMVQLRDGRKIIGILRSFDQFANLVLEGERCLLCAVGLSHAPPALCGCGQLATKAQLAGAWLAGESCVLARALSCSSWLPLPQPHWFCRQVLALAATSQQHPGSPVVHSRLIFLSPQLHCCSRSGAKERIIVGAQYGEIPLGLHVVRGENVVLMGEIDEARDPPPGLSQVRQYVWVCVVGVGGFMVVVVVVVGCWGEGPVGAQRRAGMGGVGERKGSGDGGGWSVAAVGEGIRVHSMHVGKACEHHVLSSSVHHGYCAAGARRGAPHLPFILSRSKPIPPVQPPRVPISWLDPFPPSPAPPPAHLMPGVRGGDQGGAACRAGGGEDEGHHALALHRHPGP